MKLNFLHKIELKELIEMIEKKYSNFNLNKKIVKFFKLIGNYLIVSFEWKSKYLFIFEFHQNHSLSLIEYKETPIFSNEIFWEQNDSIYYTQIKK
jgi:hypothetical protein